MRLDTVWEQSVDLRPREIVLGTTVEHKEHLTGELDGARLSIVSFH